MSLSKKEKEKEKQNACADEELTREVDRWRHGSVPSSRSPRSVELEIDKWSIAGGVVAYQIRARTLGLRSMERASLMITRSPAARPANSRRGMARAVSVRLARSRFSSPLARRPRPNHRVVVDGLGLRPESSAGQNPGGWMGRCRAGPKPESRRVEGELPRRPPGSERNVSGVARGG